MMRFLFLFVAFLQISFFDAHSRWATREDVGVAVNFFQRDINIKKDGTYQERFHIKMTILNESGRDQLALYPIFYNGSSEKVKILKAQTNDKGTSYKVSENNIVDKAIASSELGFDELRKVSIAFPKLGVNAQIELIFERQVLEPSLSNFASFSLSFGEIGIWEHCVVNIKTEMPLYVDINDPHHILETSYVNPEQSMKGFSIHLKNKDFTSLKVNEPQGSLTNPKKLTWVDVSSEKIWNRFSGKLLPGYQSVMNQKHPPILEAIWKKASEVKGDVEQINMITSEIIRLFHYLGDWRTVKNQIFPRDLKTIVETQTGDCKDFSVMLASIAQKLGYETSFVLVYRGFNNILVPEVFPLLQSFNHVFVRLKSQTGKTYWVDPTNAVSMAQGIFPDVADRPVLIIGGNDAQKYQKSPAVNPEKNGVAIEHTIRFDSSPAQHIIDYEATGHDAALITGLSLYMSEKSLEEYLFDYITAEPLKDEDAAKMILPNLNSRDVKTVKIKITMKKKQYFKKTNLGPGIPLGYQSLEKILFNSEQQVNDMSLGIPKTLFRKTRLKNTSIPGGEAFNISVDTPYIRINREMVRENKDSLIIDKLTIKKPYLPAEALNSEDIKRFRELVKENILESIYIMPNLDYAKIS
ncbi:MAG: hypothetical protein C0582_01500 [Alphaproteobacteria bacterium]|nr:MAG: hypothetical protein C0582_01500 [Alphaproteobacteria bacterium]